METVLKSFPLQLVFRGFFPGVFFVVSYLVASQGWGELKSDRTITAWPKWLSLAIFVGMIVYIVHRSLVYPILEALLDKCRCCNPTLIYDDTIKRLLKMWSFGEKEKEKESISRHLTAWNDYVHVQYASVLCILLGPAVHCFRGKPDVALISLAILFAVSAVISELRLRSVAGEALKLWPSDRAQ